MGIWSLFWPLCNTMATIFLTVIHWRWVIIPRDCFGLNKADCCCHVWLKYIQKGNLFTRREKLFADSQKHEKSNDTTTLLHVWRQDDVKGRFPFSTFLGKTYQLQVNSEILPNGGRQYDIRIPTSSIVASTICLEGQSERTFLIFPLLPSFFLIFSLFLSILGNFFAVKRGTLPPCPQDDGSVYCCYDYCNYTRLQNCVVHSVLRVIGWLMSNTCHAEQEFPQVGGHRKKMLTASVLDLFLIHGLRRRHCHSNLYQVVQKLLGLFYDDRTQ